YSKYKIIEPILKSISAKYQMNGKKYDCVEYLGESGIGHFVKMVHNGIEYSVMQLISEIFLIDKTKFKMLNEKCSSYLLNATVEILEKRSDVIENVKGEIKMKGTGVWCLEEAANVGIAPTLSAAVFARRATEQVNELKMYASDFKIEIEDNCLLNSYKLAQAVAHIEGMKIIQSRIKNNE
ncbi:MAG: hypothetical protein RR941_06740, partial [Erysipelotrichaceae bacterium]